MNTEKTNNSTKSIEIVSEVLNEIMNEIIKNIPDKKNFTVIRKAKPINKHECGRYKEVCDYDYYNTY
jgi:hypothetical protein